MATMNYLMGSFLGFFAVGISCLGFRILGGKDVFKKGSIWWLLGMLLLLFQYVFYNYASWLNRRY